MYLLVHVNSVHDSNPQIHRSKYRVVYVGHVLESYDKYSHGLMPCIYFLRFGYNNFIVVEGFFFGVFG